MEGDEFTFPTPPPPAQAEEQQRDLRDLPFPWHSAGTTSAIWPFSTPNATPPTGATTVDEASTSPASRLVQQHAEAEDEQDQERAAAEERMDLLWEDFNARELLRRVHSRAASTTTDHRAGAPWPGSADGRSPSTSSDAESEETSTSGPRRYGCAPTMLRASSRAGGVGQFYDTNRRRRSRRTAGWTLLLSLFRRLFAVDKTTTTSSHSRSHGIYAP